MAFAKCSSLEQVDFPDSVTHIEDCAFVGCSSLYAKPPASVQSYGPGAFNGCRVVSVPIEGLAAFEASISGPHVIWL